MRHVILDCDPGIDDALAIILALNSRKLDVKGITTVFGNSTVEQASKNALRILDYMKTSLPVFRGTDAPLVLKAVDATDVFGKDALGDVALPYSNLAAKDGAVRFIIDEVKAGEVDTIIATGPLTNIAKAFEEDNETMSSLKSLIIMGGAVCEPGNIDRFSEFNFYCDPHAANSVLHQEVDKVLIPLDVTNRVVLTPKDSERFGRNKRTKVVQDMVRVVQRFDMRVHGFKGTPLHDPLAVGYAIDSSFVQTKKLDVLVETDGMFTRGMCVPERRTGENAKRASPNVDVGLGVKSRRFLKYFMDTISKT